MSSTTKDYSDVNRLALGHITHEQLAQKLLQQTRSSEELMSVLRAGHDRIQYFLCGKPISDTPMQVEALTDVEQADAGKNTEKFRLESEIRDLQKKLDAATIDAQTNTRNLQNAETQIAQQSAALATANAELEKVQTELTTAYMGKQLAETAQQEAESKLKDITDNYEIDESDSEETEKVLADAADTSNDTYYVPTKPELQAIALKHGFRVRQQADGKEDLNDYVYATIFESIELSHERSKA